VCSDDAGVCAPDILCTSPIASDGGIALGSPDGLYLSVNGIAGYAYSDGDHQGFDVCSAGTSLSCITPGQLCAAGVTGVADNATTGAGLGFSLNQAETGNNPAHDYTPSGSSLVYAVSAVPAQGLVIALVPAATVPNSKYYYYYPSDPSGVIPLTAFNTTPWDTSSTEYYVAGTPIQALTFNAVAAQSGAMPFDFCVTDIGFQ
jgi:hypothetical protein